MRTPSILALGLCLTGALLMAIYWPGLHGGFSFDDGPSILQAEGVRLDTLSVESLQQALQSGGAGPTGRPIAQLSFALNHFFSGFDPFAFKVTNLTIHFANGLLVFWLILHLLTSALPQTKRRNMLLVGGGMAALWLLHPIQLLSVLHVVQRMTSLSAFFLLAALLLHILGRERAGRPGAIQLLIAWGILWPLSVLTKETGALFPLFVLAWELILRRSAHGSLDRFARGYVALTSLALMAVAAYALSPAMQWLWSGYDLRPFSLVERLLTEARVLWFYLGLIAFPRIEALGLYHDDIAISTGLFSPWSTLPAVAGLVGLVWVAWRVRTRAPLVAFGIAWFLIGHAMESTALPLEIAHEHRNYLPLLGILIAFSYPLLRMLESSGVRKTTGMVLLFSALSYFPFITALRSHQFANAGQQTQLEAQYHRKSSHAQFDAGNYLAELPEAASTSSPIYSFARAHYKLASELDSNSKISWLGLIQLNCKAGQPAERAWINELSRRLGKTPFAPADQNVLYSVKETSIGGTLCLTRSDVELLFTAAISNPTVSRPVRAILYSWYADYLVLRAKDRKAGQIALAKSLELVPSNASNRLKWAQLILLEGQREEAARLLRALRGAPLSTSEKATANRLLTCLEANRSQCG